MGAAQLSPILYGIGTIKSTLTDGRFPTWQRCDWKTENVTEATFRRSAQIERQLWRIPSLGNMRKIQRKAMFTIEAVICDSTSKPIESRRWTFFRPYCTLKPTWKGAARMIANARNQDGIPTMPRDVAVLRIEAVTHETH